MVLSSWLITIVRVHPVHLINADRAANTQTKSIDSLPSTSTIAICYYYSAHKPILILPSHGGWKAEST